VDEQKKANASQEDVEEENTEPQAEGREPEAGDEVAKLRREAAKYRTGQRRLENELASIKSLFAKALGQDTEDPARLVEELNTIKTQYRQERLHNTFLRVAAKEGADAELTWAFLVANNRLEDIDVAEAGLQSEVTGVVKEALKHNAKLKATAAMTTGGAEFSGSGPRGKKTMNELIRERAARSRL